jgi:endogenous inhibitor of DNA gyrase (YacG/DUF329 family)
MARRRIDKSPPKTQGAKNEESDNSMACPMCDKDTDAKYRPFCSKRCSDLDLGKWLTEAYVIPAADTDEEDGMSSDTLFGKHQVH